MSELTRPSDRRFRPVRLTDIPLEKRMSAARRLCETCEKDERAAILLAAIRPSPTTYWIAA